MGSIDNPPIVRPSFSEAARYWARLGWIAFGGPSGQIAILHEELVERRRWIAEEDFLGGLNYCMMLPGPEIQQFATYLGWRLHGVRGAAAAGLLFFLPAMILLWALSLGEAAGGGVSDGSAAILGGRIMAEIEAAAGGYTPEQIKAVAILRMGDHERIKREQAGELLQLKRESQSQMQQRLDLDKKRFQRQTCELFLKWAEDDRARKVVESRDSNSQKIEQLGQVLFGEDW